VEPVTANKSLFRAWFRLQILSHHVLPSLSEFTSGDGETQ
jgi:hypothetical protein